MKIGTQAKIASELAKVLRKHNCTAADSKFLLEFTKGLIESTATVRATDEELFYEAVSGLRPYI